MDCRLGEDSDFVRVGLGIPCGSCTAFPDGDVVIILADGISLLLLLGIFYFKWRPQSAVRRQLKNDIVARTFVSLAASP